MFEKYSTDSQSTADFSRPICSIGGALKIDWDHNGEYTQVEGDLIYIMGPGITRDIHEVTHLSTQQRKNREFIGGWIDAGLYEIEFSWNRTSFEYFINLMNANFVKNFSMTLSNGVIYYARAFVKQVHRTNPRAGRIFYKVQLKVVPWVGPRVYATWDPEGQGINQSTFSEDLLAVTFTKNRALRTCLSTVGLERSYYVEIEPLMSYGWFGYLGLSVQGIPLYELAGAGNTNTLGNFPGSLRFSNPDYSYVGYTSLQGVYTAKTLYPYNGYPWTAGNIISIVRKQNGNVYFAKNGQWLSTTSGGVTYDFAAAEPILTNFTGLVYAAVATGNEPNAQFSARANFGQNPWAYDPPEGFEGVYE